MHPPATNPPQPDDPLPPVGAGGAPAFLSGTSQVYLGRRPAPRVVRQRPVLLLMGPPGVGKSSVARQVMGPAAVELTGPALLAESASALQKRGWSEALLGAPTLILDLPAFLERRPGFARTVSELVLARVQAGLRTALIEPEDGQLLSGLAELIPTEHRATVLLRYPVGRGRKRHAQRLCKELGLPLGLSAVGARVEPWSWEAARAALLAAAPLD